MPRMIRKQVYMESRQETTLKQQARNLELLLVLVTLIW